MRINNHNFLISSSQTPTWQTMVPPPLDVQRHQVIPQPSGRGFSEQMSCQLFGNMSVKVLDWLTAQSPYKPIYTSIAKVIDRFRSVEYLEI